MRILFLLTQDLESPSGLGRYLPLAKELGKLGNTVNKTWQSKELLLKLRVIFGGNTCNMETEP